MIRINLMPRAEARRQAARQRDRQIATLIAIGLALIVLVAEILSRRSLGVVEEQAREHEQELIELNRRHQDAIQLDKRRAQLRAKLATIDVLDRQRRGPVHVLDDLGSATPEKLWIVEMKESGGALTLIGKGLDNQTIAGFMRKLAASPYFENVDLVETKQIEEGQAKLKQFTISARVNYAGRAMPTPAPPADADQGGSTSPEEGAPSGSSAPGGASPPGGSASPGDAAVPDSAANGVASGAVEGAAVVRGGPAGPLSGPLAARDAARAGAAVAEGRNSRQDAAAAEVGADVESAVRAERAR